MSAERGQHICKESDRCLCCSTHLEPNENCPRHGAGNWPPRCDCGKYVKRVPWKAAP